MYCAGKAMRDAGRKPFPVQIHQIQQDGMKTCTYTYTLCTPTGVHNLCTLGSMCRSSQFPIYTQRCKYNTQKLGCCGATEQFAGVQFDALLDVWVLVPLVSGAGVKVSNASLEILKIIVSPSATEVWQHLQMSLPVWKIFCISHPLEWRLPIKCLFATL